MLVLKKIKNRLIMFLDTVKKRFMRPEAYARDIGVSVGENCEILHGVFFGSEPYLIKIGNNVRITSGVKFITHDGGIYVLRNNGKLPNADIFGKIVVGNNVHIGMDAIIMPNVTIGDNVVIGCGAVVTKDIPSNCVVAGVPARVIKSIDEYYEKQKQICDFTKEMSPSEKRKYLKEKFKLN